MSTVGVVVTLDVVNGRPTGVDEFDEVFEVTLDSDIKFTSVEDSPFV